MPDAIGLGLERKLVQPVSATPIEHVLIRRPLHRILSFTRRTIDEVVNDPIAKNEVYGYFKLDRQVRRACEVVDLERWWNGA